MQFSTTTTDAPRIRAGCLLAGLFEGRDATPAYRALDDASGGKLDAVVRKARFRGDTGRHLRIHALDAVTAESTAGTSSGSRGSRSSA